MIAVFAATHEGWNVPVIGSSHRWAAVLIFLLASATCGLGSPDPDPIRRAQPRLFAVLGITAFVLMAVAVATGSLTPLWLLVVDIRRHVGGRDR